MDTLASIVGRDHVLTDVAVRAGFEVDWTGRFRAPSRGVVRPANTAEVAACVRACAAAGVAIVPQGGNTGLVGGGVPRGGEVVLSLRRLDAIGAVDRASRQLTVGAGVTLANAQSVARAAKLDVPVDLAARDGATIGGMVATNAGGNQVMRFGAMRRHVVGLTVVLASGDIVSRSSGLEKDNVGYDLVQLMAGSEGTLGIITDVVLRLTPVLPCRATALIGVVSVAAALRLAVALRATAATLDAIELMFDNGVALTCAHLGLAHPLPNHPRVCVLAECAATFDPADELVAAIAGHDAFANAVVATDGPTRATLWNIRDGHAEALNADGVPIKLDVTLPLGTLAAFAERCPRTVSDVLPGARTVMFGHLGDGNIHVNVAPPVWSRDTTAAIETAVLRLVVDHGGSISAEHGIGVAKAPFLSLGRSTADIAAMRAIKRALDPLGLLNPGVIFGVDPAEPDGKERGRER